MGISHGSVILWSDEDKARKLRYKIVSNVTFHRPFFYCHTLWSSVLKTNFFESFSYIQGTYTFTHKKGGKSHKFCETEYSGTNAARVSVLRYNKCLCKRCENSFSEATFSVNFVKIKGNHLRRFTKRFYPQNFVK